MRTVCVKWLGVALCAVGVSVVIAQTNELRSTLNEQQAVAVTIYNNDLALIKDQRRVSLSSGVVNLAFRDVSAKMRPETAQLRSLNTLGGFNVLEQNFDFDLLTPNSLLSKYAGKEVTVLRSNPSTGVESRETATVLSTQEGVVLKIGSRIETGVPGRLVFDEVPSTLRDRPTLSMLLDSKRAATQDVELSYLTGGLSWRADYVVELNATEDKLAIGGWVTLTNDSGSTYRNAKLQLVAGDVNRVRSETRSYVVPKTIALERAVAPAMQEESLLEYHLYTLDRPTTLAERQTKQVSLLAAEAVPVRKELVLQGQNYYYYNQAGSLGQKLKFGVFVEFENRESANLGMPLPKGVMRVYKKDRAGNAQFVGEDRIDHTAKNEKVRLKLGEAFDVNADRRQTDFKRVSDRVTESAYQLVLRNAKAEAVEVLVQEPIPGEWQMLSSSHAFVKAAANTVVWRVKIPAEGQLELNYRVACKN